MPMRYSAVSLVMCVCAWVCVCVCVCISEGVEVHYAYTRPGVVLFIPHRLINKTNGWLKTLWWRPKHEFVIPLSQYSYKGFIVKWPSDDKGQEEWHLGKETSVQKATSHSWQVDTSIRIKCFPSAPKTVKWFLVLQSLFWFWSDSKGW